jgi:hypothetical protein
MNISNGMNDQRNKETMQERERRALPFFVEFIKFATGFAAIIAVGLITLHAASAAIG